MTFNDEVDSYPLKVTRLTTYDSRGGVNQVRTGRGFLHSVTFAQADAAPTAGTISIYDSTSIYGDTALFIHTQTTGIFMPQTVILDMPFSNGLAVGFTAGMLDVGVTLSYK